uniref:Myelin and lymphocyte protein n=1 Tax=Equus asinus asinus TaxID=83772 RepID=A0A8C4PI35_EQUAS
MKGSFLVRKCPPLFSASFLFFCPSCPQRDLWVWPFLGVGSPGPMLTLPSFPPQVFGGLVWMLITSSQLPNPLVQGWVTFVSVFCFIGTGALLFLYLTGAHGGETSWVSLESAYHTVAVLLYSIASILEILATIYMQDGFTYEHYLENISAVVSAPSASPCSQLPLPADRGSEQKAALLCPGLG